MENENKIDLLNRQVKFLPIYETKNGNFYIIEKILNKRTKNKHI